jgi:hypothetical protein
MLWLLALSPVTTVTFVTDLLSPKFFSDPVTTFTDRLFQDISPFLWSKAAERDINRGIDTSSEKLERAACVAGTHAA